MSGLSGSQGMDWISRSSSRSSPCDKGPGALLLVYPLASLHPISAQAKVQLGRAEVKPIAFHYLIMRSRAKTSSSPSRLAN